EIEMRFSRHARQPDTSHCLKIIRKGDELRIGRCRVRRRGGALLHLTHEQFPVELGFGEMNERRNPRNQRRVFFASKILGNRGLQGRVVGNQGHEPKPIQPTISAGLSVLKYAHSGSSSLRWTISSNSGVNMRR